MTTILQDFHACQARRLRRFIATLDAADRAGEAALYGPPDERGMERRARQRATARRWLARADMLAMRRPRPPSSFSWYKKAAYSIWRRHKPAKLTAAYYAELYGVAAE